MILTVGSQRSWLSIAALWLCAGACERHASQSPEAARPSPARVAVMAAALPASQPTPQEPTPAEPLAAYDSLAAACEGAETFIRRSLGVSVERHDTATFENEFVRQQRTGCRLTADGTFKDSGLDPANHLSDAFLAAGWVWAQGYSADGPDGTVTAMRSRETLCIIEFQWDGGDDSDPSYVPGDWYKAMVSCAPGVTADVIPE